MMASRRMEPRTLFFFDVSWDQNEVWVWEGLQDFEAEICYRTQTFGVVMGPKGATKLRAVWFGCYHQQCGLEAFRSKGIAHSLSQDPESVYQQLKDLAEEWECIHRLF